MEFIKRFRKPLLTVAIAASLTACGGGGSSSGDTTSSSEVTGVAAKGIITNGVVTAYQADGTTVLATASTDGQGRYSLSIPGDYNGPVLIRVTADSSSQMICDNINGCGGSAFGEPVDLDENSFAMDAVLPSVTGSNTLTGHVTPLTHLAAAHALAANPNGLTTETAEIAIDQLQQSFPNIDIDGDEPLDLTDPAAVAAATSDQIQAAAIGASLMGYAEANGQGIEQALANVSAQYASQGQLVANEAEDGNDLATLSIEDMLETAQATLTELQTLDQDGDGQADYAEAADSIASASTAVSDDIATVEQEIEGTLTDNQGTSSTQASNLETVKSFLGDFRSIVNSIAVYDNAAGEAVLSEPAQAFATQLDNTGPLLEATAELLGEYLAVMSEIALTGDEYLAAEYGVNLIDNGDGTYTATTIEGSGAPVADLTFDLSTGKLTGTIDGYAVDLTYDIPSNISGQTFTAGITGSISSASTGLTITTGSATVEFASQVDLNSSNIPMPASARFDLEAVVNEGDDSFTGEIGFSAYGRDDAHETIVPATATLAGRFDLADDSFEARLSASVANAATWQPSYPTLPNVGSTADVGDYSFSTDGNTLTIVFENYQTEYHKDDSGSIIKSYSSDDGYSDSYPAGSTTGSLQEWLNANVSADQASCGVIACDYLDTDNVGYSINDPASFELAGGDIHGTVMWVDDNFDFTDGETGASYLQVGAILTLTANLGGNETVVRLEADRTGLESGDATLRFTHAGKWVEFEGSSEGSDITVTNQDGVTMTLRDNGSAGELVYNGSVYGTINESAAVPGVDLVDKTFESLL